MQRPDLLKGYAILLLILALMLAGVCGGLEIGVEAAVTPDRAAVRTVEALETANARLATSLATLRAQATANHVENPSPADPTSTLIQLATPTLTPSPTQVPTLPPTDTPTPACTVLADWPIYTVQQGDTLYRIARATGSTVAILAEANCLDDPDRINAGQPLRVPALPALPTDVPALVAETPTPLPTPMAATDTPAPPIWPFFFPPTHEAADAPNPSDTPAPTLSPDRGGFGTVQP